VIVTIHLLLGMGLLAMLTWLAARQHQGAGVAESSPAAALPALRRLHLLTYGAAIVLTIQIALGGWVSTNYATLACADFPLCNGAWVPEMDFEHGFALWRELGKTAAGDYLPFPALTAIHWVHRNFAWLVVLLVGLCAWRAWPHPALRQTARLLLIVLGAQVVTGVATVYLNFPLAIAVLHNAGAALLVLLLTMLNYQTSHRNGAAMHAKTHQ
jgi:cytochrome c oxidase assembly protein subunit 15